MNKAIAILRLLTLSIIPMLSPGFLCASAPTQSSGFLMSDNKARALGMELEHDEWKPGVIITADSLLATFKPNPWLYASS